MQISERQRVREFYYALISRLLVAEVDIETIEAIKSDNTLSSLFVYSKESNDYLSKKSKEIVKDLASHYSDLFLIKLVPYESFYTSENQMVNSGTDNETFVFYKKYGFDVELMRARVVSADHIGIEFEFMMNLVRAQRDALNNGEDEYASTITEVQKEFIKKHLLPFAIMFLPALLDASKSPFYKDVAEMALEFLLTDYEELCSK